MRPLAASGDLTHRRIPNLRRPALPSRHSFAATLLAAFLATACAKPADEAAAPPAATDDGAPAAAVNAPAAPLEPRERELLAKAKAAGTALERRQAYAELVRLYPDNRDYKRELRRARRQARAERKAADKPATAPN